MRDVCIEFSHEGEKPSQRHAAVNVDVGDLMQVSSSFCPSEFTIGSHQNRVDSRVAGHNFS